MTVAGTPPATVRDLAAERVAASPRENLRWAGRWLAFALAVQAASAVSTAITWHTLLDGELVFGLLVGISHTFLVPVVVTGLVTTVRIAQLTDAHPSAIRP